MTSSSTASSSNGRSTSLPEREQEILRLRFFEDLTQTEIADRVGVSQMHVSRLLAAALRVSASSCEPPIVTHDAVTKERSR